MANGLDDGDDEDVELELELPADRAPAGEVAAGLLPLAAAAATKNGARLYRALKSAD